MAVTDNAQIFVNNWCCSCGYNNPTKVMICGGMVKDKDGKMVKCDNASNYAQ